MENLQSDITELIYNNLYSIVDKINVRNISTTFHKSIPFKKLKKDGLEYRLHRFLRIRNFKCINRNNNIYCINNSCVLFTNQKSLKYVQFIYPETKLTNNINNHNFGVKYGRPYVNRYMPYCICCTMEHFDLTDTAIIQRNFNK